MNEGELSFTMARSFLCHIEFDGDDKHVIGGWFAFHDLIEDPDVPGGDGTYILQAVRNGITTTLSWVLKE